MVTSGVLSELGASVDAIDAEAGSVLGAALEQWRAAVLVQISGRGGVGKSAVADAIEWPIGVEIMEVSIDVPGSSSTNTSSSTDMFDGDLAVHVLAGLATDPDADALTAMGAVPVVVVLNKADAFGGVEDIFDACAAADRVLRRPEANGVLPLMCPLARAACGDLEPIRGLGQSPFLGAHMLLDADLPVSVDRRGDLLDRYEMYGIAALQQSLAAEPALTPGQASTIVHAISGIDAVNTAVRLAVLRVRGRRDGELMQILEVLAAGHDRARDVIEGFLRSDHAVLAGMRAGLSSRGDIADRDILAGNLGFKAAALTRAVFWRDRGHETQDADHERAAVAISRGFLRMWAAAPEPAMSEPLADGVHGV